jgi:hypothetical protein
MFGRRSIEVPCLVDIEQSFESLHAHAIPEGIVLRPGDRVMVHGLPEQITPGVSLHLACTATVYRAGWLTRVWTEARAILDLAELYHCGFEPKEAT